MAHKFETFEGNGRFAINAGTDISNGIRPFQRKHSVALQVL